MQIQLLTQGVSYINVVIFIRIPPVVLKNGPIYFSVYTKDVCFPVKTQTRESRLVSRSESYFSSSKTYC